MRMPTVGWAFFILAVIVLAGYVLNRGIFIGSEVRPTVGKTINGTDIVMYVRHCRYLHLAGIGDFSFMAVDTPEAANQGICRMFHE